MNMSERKVYIQLKYGKIELTENFIKRLPDELCVEIIKEEYTGIYEKIKSDRDFPYREFLRKVFYLENRRLEERPNDLEPWKIIDRLETIIENYEQRRTQNLPSA